MSRCYLFGPVSPTFADQNLSRARQAGECLAFNAEGTTDLAIGPLDDWGQACARLPSGWQADYIVLYLPYTSVPNWLWTASVPIVGLAPDWPLLWHYYRLRLRACDLVLTDRLGAEHLKREGIGPVQTANLAGCEKACFEMFSESQEDGAGVRSSKVQETRAIDVLFVGNLNAAVHPDRTPWLARLARRKQRRHRQAIRLRRRPDL